MSPSPRPGHKCPGPRCKVYLPYRLLACGPHWRQVPRPFQTAVYAAWDHGKGAGSEAHQRAMVTAIEFMTELGE